MDSAGNLYGTTQEGGTRYGCNCGTVFKLTGRTETILYNFQGTDGEYPAAGLVLDGAGNLYGTTAGGGANNVGVVFELAPDGTETVLHSFGSGSDGTLPDAELIMDKNGRLFGVTQQGGSYGYGTAYKLAPDGTETVLHSFAGGTDGAYPQAALIRDKSGNLYGTTNRGGNTNCKGIGCGIIFELAPDGTETVLYTFCSKSNCADGAEPYANLIVDSQGNFYGTTAQGGSTGCYANSGCGTIFKLTSNGTETVLYAFKGGNDGAGPAAGLIFDRAGNLYGTTYAGGGSGYCGDGCGTVFELTPNGTETLLYSFGIGRESSLKQGENPMAGVVMDKKGNLDGTTLYGGIMDSCFDNGCGTVFRLKR